MKGSFQKRIHLRKFSIGFIVFLVLLMNCYISIEFVNCNPHIHPYREEDYFIDSENSVAMYTDFVFPDAKVFVNFTILTSSYSDVSLTPTSLEGVIWSPIESSIILQPGENYSETFALVSSVYGDTAPMSYNASVLVENSNATVRFGFNLIYTRTNPIVLPIFPLFLGLVASTIIVINRKRISNQ